MIINNNTFPRELGVPRKIINNKDDFLKFINTYNGFKKAIYSSVYHFDKLITISNYQKPDYDSAIIDCLYFDFDDKDCDAYNEMFKLHNFCLERNIKHKVIMSGGGYHVYIYTSVYKPQNVRGTIYNAQYYFINNLNLKMDTHVIGNPAQLARVPNTWNGKREKFAIPLTRQQILEGDDFIKDLAIKQNFVDGVIGEELFDLKEFDYEPKGFDVSEEIKNIDLDLDGVKIELPPCLKNIIKNGEMRWKERYLIIMFMKEKGFNKNNVFDFLKEHCSENKLKHCVNQEKQLDYLFGRDDLTFPCCDKIKLDGYCIGKCQWYNNVIYKENGTR